MKILKKIQTKARILAAFIFLTVTFQNFSYANMQAAVESYSNQISLAPELGNIQEVYNSGAGPFVFCIQNLHCHKEAQNKISQIINLLKTAYGERLSVMGLEGESGNVDLSLLAGIPDKNIKDEVVNYFLDRGELTGPALFAIRNPNCINIIGLEDEELYNKNLKQLYDSLFYQNGLEGVLNKLRRQIDRGKDIVYPSDLREFEKNYSKYNLAEQIQYLKKTAPDLGVSLENLYQNLMSFDKGFRNNPILLIQEMNELEYIIKKSMLKGRNDGQRILYCDRYLDLLNKLLSNNVSVYDYENWQKGKKRFYEFADIMIGKLSVNNTFAEYKDIIDRAVTNMQDFYNLAEKRNEVMVGNLLKQQPCYPEFDCPVKGGSRSTKNEYLTKTPDQVRSDINVRHENAREITLSSRNSSPHNDINKNISIMVLGGFHIKGVTQILRSRGISYAVINPNITKKYDKNIYLARLEEEASAVISASSFVIPAKAGIFDRYQFGED
ncbi:MAG: hypothetical protein ABH857_00490, partial [Elusimicrobiota bacterium]